MNYLCTKRRHLACVTAVAVGLTQTLAAWAQQVRPIEGGVIISPSTAPATAPAPAGAVFKQEELEAILAPLALYPDSLLSQILMASTYPVEVVQADRWAKQNKSLKGDALGKALEAQPWDPSVRSLVNFPDVLTMMSEKLDWTVKLGDAFIGQQKDVMDTVQKLRGKAQAQGSLASNDKQKVIVEAASATQPTSTTQIIKIESTSPDVVYVPTYNPTVVYGAWAYPSYPPYSYYPPNYYPGQAAVAFGVGVAIGAAWGYAWGGCNWGHSDVEIDIDRNTNINTNIDREKYKAERDARQTDRQGNRTERQTGRDGSRAGGASTFQHDPSHRQGVAYRDQATAQKFGGASSNQAVQARESYRGRAEAGRQDIARGGADSYRSGSGSYDRGGTGSGRTYSGAADRSSSVANRPSSSGTRSSAYSGAGSSGSTARTYSDRGQTSRSSSGSYNRGSSGGGGSRSAPARSSGGGGRGGGGGGGRR